MEVFFRFLNSYLIFRFNLTQTFHFYWFDQSQISIEGKKVHDFTRPIPILTRPNEVQIDTLCKYLNKNPNNYYDRPNSYRRKEKERARFHYQYSNLRSLQPKFKPSHKLNRSVLTKLERNYSNHKYQRREGRKFLTLLKIPILLSFPNQDLILTRIFNINIGIIIHRYRSKKISYLLSDQFKISCERLTESRRKLDRQKDPSRHFRFHSFASHQITYSDPLIQNISFPQNRIAPFLLNALKIQEEIGGRKERRFSQTANAIIVRVPTV